MRDPELEHRPAAYDLNRVQLFSDGVFGIATTIIVVTAFPDAVTEDTLRQYLLDQWPFLISYVVAFMSIGIYWSMHHSMFGLLVRADAGLLWSNLFLLMLVVFWPFPTRVVGTYFHDFGFAFVIFNLVALLIGLTTLTIWSYACSKHRLVSPRLGTEIVKKYRLRALITSMAFGLAIILSLLHVRAAPLAWLVLLAIWPIERALVGKKAEMQDADTVDPDKQDPGVRDAEKAQLNEQAEEGYNLGRVLAFSDAIYAIAITLLVVLFKIPETDPATNAALVTFYGGIVQPAVVSYVAGFVTIGLFWVMHHQRFLYIRRQDGVVRVLNLVHLMFVALLPFSAFVLADFGPRVVPVVLFSVNASLVSLTIAALWWYATAHPAALVSDYLPAMIQRTRRVLGAVAAIFAVSIAAGFVIPGYTSAIWLVALLVVVSLSRSEVAARGTDDTGPEPASEQETRHQTATG